MNVLLSNHIHLVGTIHNLGGPIAVMHSKAVPDFFKRYERLLSKPTTLIIAEAHQQTREISTGLFAYLPTSRNYDQMLKRVLGENPPPRIKASIAFADDRNTSGTFAFCLEIFKPIVEESIRLGYITQTKEMPAVGKYDKETLFKHFIDAEVQIADLEEYFQVDYLGIAQLIKNSSWPLNFLKNKLHDLNNCGPEKAVTRSIKYHENIYTDFIIVCGAAHAATISKNLRTPRNIIIPNELEIKFEDVMLMETIQGHVLLMMIFFSKNFMTEIEKHI